MSFRVDVHKLKNFNEAQRDKALLSFSYIDLATNNPKFWKEAEELWDKCTHKWTTIDGPRTPITFQEYKDLILSGRDKFNPEADGDLDLYLTLYYSWKNTIGYTYPSTWWTWTNRKYFSRFDYGDFAGHVWHEYHHNIGMDHPGTDRQSVVYMMGYLMRDFIKREYLNKMPPTPIRRTPKKKRRNIFVRAWRWFRRKF